MIRILFSLFFLSCSLCAQTTFEKVFHSSEDTSSVGIYSLPLANGEVILLHDKYNFNPSATGIPFHGEAKFANILTKLSKEGNPIWSTRLIPGKVDKLILDNQNNIIIPFIINIGYQACEENIYTAMNTDKSGFYKIDFHTGAVLNKYIPNRQDKDCISHHIIASHIDPENNLKLLLFDDNHDDFFLQTINTEFSTTSEEEDIDLAYNNNYYYVYKDNILHEDTDNIFAIHANRDSLFTFNNQGKLINQIALSLPSDGEFYLNSNSQFILARTKRFIYESGDNRCRLDIFTHKGLLIDSLIFPMNEIIVDAKLTKDNKIVTISQIGGFHSYENLPEKPLLIKVFDLKLNLLGQKEYGFKYVRFRHMTFTEENEIVITGTRYKSTDFNNGLEADQVYILKENISNITEGNDSDINSELSFLNFNPNPTEGELIGEYHLIAPACVQYSVYNAWGVQLINAKAKLQLAGYHLIKLDLSPFANGKYFISFQVNGESFNKMVLKI